MNPASIDEWFPVEQQRKYVSQFNGKVGVTRRRAEYFVRLWAYLLLKEQQELGLNESPITELVLPQGFIPCTHREAHELFYGQSDRGSERAAGMMIDKLVALGLIEKKFDGNTICIRVRSELPSTNDLAVPSEIKFVADAFNPRIDTIPVASFLACNYDWMNKKNTALPQKIARILRGWAQIYPTGMRVLRRRDTQDPVGFYVLYPTAPESEDSFFLPPSKSLHLSATNEADPIKIATPGDRNCTSIFVRSFQIDVRYQQGDRLCHLLEDVKSTIINMQADFPNLCDMYALTIHPSAENLAIALGFQKTAPDPQLSLYWLYMAIDKFLVIDIPKAISVLKFD